MSPWSCLSTETSRKVYTKSSIYFWGGNRLNTWMLLYQVRFTSATKAEHQLTGAVKVTMSASLCSLLIREQDCAPAATTPSAGCWLWSADWKLTHAYLWDPHRSVDGQAWAKPGQGLDVCSGGQWPSALSVDRKGQRFEVLGIDVALVSSHRLQQVLAWDNLFGKKETKNKKNKFQVVIRHDTQTELFHHLFNLRC